ncbi:photosynthetic complex assembly protein PuhC [Roseomonas sp. AR75]|jgi:putative photosynthetic complex assembly protein|uniref:photosynthetic complex assembly protein PuhC n=1 Tax=Roseomonas sp. AR75 TaxID=2562311 RepID=UPI0010C024D5|nr:photosynthetic complex assembly protein PuhC [Roseomonas sp. AR75]
MAQALPRPAFLPRSMLLAAAAVVGGTLILAVLGHKAPVNPASTGERPVATRDLRFADRDDGAVVITDARTGGVIEVLPGGTEGFVRGAMRGLVRQRRVAGQGTEPPFRLSTWSDGRITLVDTATGNTMELHAFGRTNAEAFLKLLATGE